jgi:hypothetical protein
MHVAIHRDGGVCNLEEEKRVHCLQLLSHFCCWNGDWLADKVNKPDLTPHVSVNDVRQLRSGGRRRERGRARARRAPSGGCILGVFGSHRPPRREGLPCRSGASRGMPRGSLRVFPGEARGNDQARRSVSPWLRLPSAGRQAAAAAAAQTRARRPARSDGRDDRRGGLSDRLPRRRPYGLGLGERPEPVLAQMPCPDLGLAHFCHLYDQAPALHFPIFPFGQKNNHRH